jgi:hypothetical protein
VELWMKWSFGTGTGGTQGRLGCKKHGNATTSHSSLYQFLRMQLLFSLHMALHRFGPFPLFQFLNPIHSRYDSLDGGSASRKAATYTWQHKHRINAHRDTCLEWDSNPLSQCSSRRRRFMPQTARPLWSAVSCIQYETTLHSMD